jgi:hypothetical protein
MVRIRPISFLIVADSTGQLRNTPPVNKESIVCKSESQPKMRVEVELVAFCMTFAAGDADLSIPHA